jgi:hypothetical protein
MSSSAPVPNTSALWGSNGTEHSHKKLTVARHWRRRRMFGYPFGIFQAIQSVGCHVQFCNQVQEADCSTSPNSSECKQEKAAILPVCGIVLFGFKPFPSMNDRGKRPRIVGLPLLLLIPLGILVFVILIIRDAFTDTAVDSRWNYRRAGSFFMSTPSISADGSIILFDSARSGNGDIFKAYRGTNGAISLIASPAIEMGPILSKDAKCVAFARQTSGYQHVWLADSNGSTQVQLTHGRVIDYPLSFSSDDSRIHFVRTTFAGRAMVGKSHLFAISVTGSNLTELGHGSAVSEDGKMILQEKYDNSTRGRSIWIISREDNSERQIAEGSSARFSPDGRKIVFLQQTPNFSYNVIVSDIKGGGAHVIKAPPGFKTRPKFGLDGAGVIFRVPSSQRDGLGGAYVILLDTGEVMRLDQVPSEPLP